MGHWIPFNVWGHDMIFEPFDFLFRKIELECIDEDTENNFYDK